MPNITIHIILYNIYVQKLEEPSLEKMKKTVRMLIGGKAPRKDSIILELLIKGECTLMINLKNW